MTDEKVVVSSLLEREIRPLRNWCEWLKHWQTVISIEEMFGLLHCGFNVPLWRGEYGESEYDEIDRFIFYLTLADGWADNYLLKLPEDGNRTYEISRDHNGNVVEKSASELRQQVARKAFEMLCHNFFKLELHASRSGYEGDLERTIASPRLFPVIQMFFRSEQARFGKNITIRNLPRLDSKLSWELHVVDFLLLLVEFVWNWQQHEVPTYAKSEQQQAVVESNRITQARLDSAKPWLVEVLSRLGRLDLLRSRVTQLDEPCLAKLNEIAMRAELGGSCSGYPVKETRPVATLEEACYVGSPAAWFLKNRELKLSVGKRLTEILKAEQAAEDATQELRRLKRDLTS